MTIDEEVIATLKVWAKNEGRSLSFYVSQILAKFIELNKE